MKAYNSAVTEQKSAWKSPFGLTTKILGLLFFSSQVVAQECKIPSVEAILDKSAEMAAINEYNLYMWHAQDAIHRRPQATVEQLISSDSFLIRHATSAHNEGYKIYGAATNRMPIFMDPYLSKQGKKDARRQGKEIAGKLNVDVVLVSPLRRCIETAYLMFKDRKDELPFIIVPQLTEVLRGVAQIPTHIDNIEQLANDWFPNGNLNMTLLETYNEDADPERWVLKHITLESILDADDNVWRQTLLDYVASLQNPYDFSCGQETFESIMSRRKESIGIVREYINKGLRVAVVTHSVYGQFLTGDWDSGKMGPLGFPEEYVALSNQ